MSDLWQLDQKVQEGSEWRGEKEVTLQDSIMGGASSSNSDDDEDVPSFTVTYRLLSEDEFAHAVDKMGAENFEQKLTKLDATRDSLEEDEIERYRELRQKDVDDLTNDEENEIEAIRKKVEDMSEGEIGSILGMMDPHLTRGFHYAAEQGVVPDEDDIDEMLNMNVPEQQERFGVDAIQTREKAEEIAQQQIKTMISRSTGFTAYSLGMDIFMESMDGGQGN